MTRLPRILLNATTVFSLVLCVLTIVLWARSLRTPLGPGGFSSRIITKNHVLRLSSAAGDAELIRVIGPMSFARPRDRTRWSESADHIAHLWRNSDQAWGLLGASLYVGGFGPGATVLGGTRIRYWALIVPLWMPTLLSALLPAIRLFHWRRGRRPDHACAVCGYDLRATPERCPECGTIKA
jgi:hypothetical protein